MQPKSAVYLARFLTLIVVSYKSAAPLVCVHFEVVSSFVIAQALVFKPDKSGSFPAFPEL